MLNETDLKQHVAEKRALAAWESAVESAVAFLSRGLNDAGVPPHLHELATAPPLVEIISVLLDVGPAEALSLMVRSVDVKPIVEDIGGSSVTFLFCRLRAFKQLLGEGHDPKVIRKIVADQYAEFRPLVGFPNVELILDEYVQRRSAATPIAVEVQPKRRSRRAPAP